MHVAAKTRLSRVPYTRPSGWGLGIGIRSKVRVLTAFDRDDVAGFSLIVEMQGDPTRLKLPQYIFDSPRYRRIVRAVTSHEFLNNSAERRWRQFRVWDTHRIGASSYETKSVP